MPDDTAAGYLRDNFQPGDRIAVVLRNGATGHTLQRIASVERIAALDYQAWLRRQNASGYEVYVSMNALAEQARSRTKEDIAAIRHVYLDFDENGNEAVRQLLARQDLPTPNYLINTSPDKWQVVWKAEGFERDQAEALQRGLVRQTGADPAATDASRVLRLPGFVNHKYDRKHWVRVESKSQETYRPADFPQSFESPTWSQTGARNGGGRKASEQSASGQRSQSERDWAYARRALARGEDPAHVVARIAAFRPDKHNPDYYAALTVRKAQDSLAPSQNPAASLSEGPER